MWRGIMTQVSRQNHNLIGFSLEDIVFEVPEVGKGFKFSIYDNSEGLTKEIFYGGSPIETIVEEYGKAGARWIIVTLEDEFIIRNVEAM